MYVDMPNKKTRILLNYFWMMKFKMTFSPSLWLPVSFPKFSTLNMCYSCQQNKE